MPPRIPALTAYCRAAPILRSPVVSFLLPLMQTRNASILGALADNPGAYNKKIKRGRGPSSGKGKTSGRGQKGQKARGKAKPRFQGGQTPLAVIHGVKGFKNIFTEDLSTINLDKIQHWIDQGRLNPEQPITLKELAKSKCLRIKDGVKLLARGKEEFKSPINILVSRASAEAIKAIEDVGGKVTTRYYTKHSVRRILKGESDSGPSSFFPFGMAPPGEPDSAIQSASKPFMYRLPDPSSRKDIEYYRDAAHRGYLSHMVPAGHGPSLFFKTPGTSPRRMGKKKGAAVATGADNKIF